MSKLILWTLSVNDYLSSYYSCDRMKSGVCSLFKNNYAQRPFQYRVLVGKSKVFVAIRASEDPVNEPALGALRTREENSPVQGAQYELKVTTNPIVQKALGGKKKGSKRVPLVRKEDIQEWFGGQLEKHGFDVVRQDNGEPWLSCSPCVRNYGVSGDWYINTSNITARVVVRDKVKAEKAFLQGIGKERKYGYGMLCLIPCSDQSGHHESDEEDD